MITLKRIRDLREDNDFTQKEVYSYLHCSESTYRLYEKGKSEIPVDKAIMLAQRYNVTLEYLTGRTDEKQPFIPIKYSIPTMLKFLRRRQHLNQDAIASVLSCSRSKYAEYEEGHKRISLTMLNLLANFYGVSIDYICGAID